MIAGERTTAYINSLDRGNTELLNQIEREAKEACVPIIRQEMQSFLKTLLAAKKPKAVLEVGTAVGFSALLMCEYGPQDMQLTTIEKYEKRIPVAKENFRRAGREDQITFLEGDAAEILHGLTGSFDFIFMDAAKGQYIHFLPDVLRLLEPGGLLVSDNVLQDGDIMESTFRGGTAEQDDPQPDAGISVYAYPSSAACDLCAAAWGRRDLKRERRKGNV